MHLGIHEGQRGKFIFLISPPVVSKKKKLDPELRRLHFEQRNRTCVHPNGYAAYQLS